MTGKRHGPGSVFFSSPDKIVGLTYPGVRIDLLITVAVLATYISHNFRERLTIERDTCALAIEINIYLIRLRKVRLNLAFTFTHHLVRNQLSSSFFPYHRSDFLALDYFHCEPLTDHFTTHRDSYPSVLMFTFQA